MNDDLSTKTTAEILARIAQLQEIQRRYHTSTQKWNEASAELQPLFAEMNRREPSRQ